MALNLFDLFDCNIVVASLIMHAQFNTTPPHRSRECALMPSALSKQNIA